MSLKTLNDSKKEKKQKKFFFLVNEEKTKAKKKKMLFSLVNETFCFHFYVIISSNVTGKKK
jgi:hypothetical protein